MSSPKTNEKTRTKSRLRQPTDIRSISRQSSDILPLSNTIADKLHLNTEEQKFKMAQSFNISPEKQSDMKYIRSPTHIRSVTLQKSFEKAKKFHSTHAFNTVRQTPTANGSKPQHNFGKPREPFNLTPGRLRPDELVNNSRYNEAISVISDIAPVSHSEFMTIGHVENVQKQQLLIKQSSLVDQEVSPTRRTRADRFDKSFNETIKSASKTCDTIDFTMLPGNQDQKESTAKFNS